MCLEIVFPVKLEGVLLQYKAEHFSEEICSYRRVIGMKVLVRVAYYSDFFLLWDIRLRLVTSIETRKAFLGTLVLSINLMKCVVSLRYESCICAIG